MLLCCKPAFRVFDWKHLVAKNTWIESIQKHSAIKYIINAYCFCIFILKVFYSFPRDSSPLLCVSLPSFVPSHFHFDFDLYRKTVERERETNKAYLLLCNCQFLFQQLRSLDHINEISVNLSSGIICMREREWDFLRLEPFRSKSEIDLVRLYDQ